MTALAFLFAVFLARPCPFYILDEVEAALDDLNIDRFLTAPAPLRRPRAVHRRHPPEAHDGGRRLPLRRLDGRQRRLQGRLPPAAARGRGRAARPSRRGRAATIRPAIRARPGRRRRGRAPARARAGAVARRERRGRRRLPIVARAPPSRGPATVADGASGRRQRALARGRRRRRERRVRRCAATAASIVYPLPRAVGHPPLLRQGPGRHGDQRRRARTACTSASTRAALWTLYHRSLAARQGVLDDPRAIALVDAARLPVRERFGGGETARPGRACAARVRQRDPPRPQGAADATVVALGEGARDHRPGGRQRPHPMDHGRPAGVGRDRAGSVSPTAVRLSRRLARWTPTPGPARGPLIRQGLRCTSPATRSTGSSMPTAAGAASSTSSRPGWPQAPSRARRLPRPRRGPRAPCARSWPRSPVEGLAAGPDRTADGAAGSSSFRSLTRARPARSTSTARGRSPRAARARRRPRPRAPPRAAANAASAGAATPPAPPGASA